MRVVLASASPARLRLLREAGLRPDVVVSNVDEDGVSAPSVTELVTALAARKADDVAGRVRTDDPTSTCIVIGCDSLLDVDGIGLGKPGTAEAARERWASIAGRSAVLRTGHSVRLLRDGQIAAAADAAGATTVHFGSPSAAELEWYVASGEPLAVAGAFTIDGMGGWFVESIEGDHHNVVGLSLAVLRALLADVGVTLTDLLPT